MANIRLDSITPLSYIKNLKMNLKTELFQSLLFDTLYVSFVFSKK